MLHAVMEGFSTTRVSNGKQSKIPEELVMLELGRRFAAVIQFNFIEAARPFKDNCLDLRERNELVNHWKKKAIHIDEMFSMFVAYLAHDRMATELDENLAPEELNESDINKMLEDFKKAYPDLYENLMDARKQQPFSLDEVSRQEKEQIGFVHGKTYLQGWRDYYNYLEKINPVAYKQEME
jgi:pheromone shutdown protein TraB